MHGDSFCDVRTKAFADAGGRKIAEKSDLKSEPFTSDFSQSCRRVHPVCPASLGGELCAACCFLVERERRQFDGQGYPNLQYSSYIAAFLLSPQGHVLDIDQASAKFLRSSGFLEIQQNRVRAANPEFDTLLVEAIDRIAYLGRPDTLIFGSTAPPASRYALLLQPTLGSTGAPTAATNCIAGYIYPLGRRRIASARQLMTLFGLTAAEARLARALCHGETLEQFAVAQGVKLSTVKTQVRSVFAKTQTDRQLTLVMLITGIPPLRLP